MTRVLIVDDLELTREQLTDYVTDAGFAVVGAAKNGREAVELVQEREPDVVTMDVKMPVMDGIEAVRRIMQTRPTPVVMVSRYTREDAEITLEALEAGAVGHFHKLGQDPAFDISEYKTQFIETVEQAARIDPASLAGTDVAPTPQVTTFGQSAASPVVVIASSTGGVRLLKRHLAALPADAGLRVLIVQHLQDEFTSRFAARLDDALSLPVRESSDGGRLGPNDVVVAAGGTHLRVDGDDGEFLSLRHDPEPTDLPVRPAADVTMRTAAEHVQGSLVGTVLTGLGRDGLAGSRAIAEAGGTVVAQDAATSPADWMPRHVRESGHVDYVCAAEELVETLLTAVERADDGRRRRADASE